MEKTDKIKNVHDAMTNGIIRGVFSKDNTMFLFEQIRTTDTKGNESTWQIVVSPYDTNTNGVIKFSKSMIEKHNEQLSDNIHGRIRVICVTHKGNEKAAEDTYVKVGKNIGKKNATNTITQAISDAHSLHKKKLKKSSDGIGASKPLPMLLKNMKDVKLTSDDYAAGLFVERKYDGARVIAHKDNTSASASSSSEQSSNIHLYSRTGKRYVGIDHLEKELSLLLTTTNLYLDGEIYIHGKSLQDISGILRSGTSSERASLNYYLYDCFDMSVPDMTQHERKKLLTSLYNKHKAKLSNIILVDTIMVHSKDEIDRLYKQYLSEGYEGAVVRKANAPYVHAVNNYHSSNILKLKPLGSDEFKIIGFEEGKKGKDVGAIIFRLITKDKVEFTAVPNMPLNDRKELFTKLSGDKRVFAQSYKDKMATIQYATLSNSGVPTQPKFIAVRDYE